MSITVTNNLPDFKRQLDRVKKEFQLKSVRVATRAAGSVFSKLAKLEAPVLDRAITGGNPKNRRVPGTLKKAIGVRNSRFKKIGEFRMWVGVKTGSKRIGGKKRGISIDGTDPFYWYFLEGGYIAHGPGSKIKGAKHAALVRSRRLAGGAKIIKRPFLNEAWKKGKAPAIEAFSKRLTKEIDKLEKIK